MRKVLVVILGVVLLSGALAGLASAQTQPSGQYPNVASLKPFTAEADFMSLPGYLRYLTFQQTGQWLTREEATRIVNQQRGM